VLCHKPYGNGYRTFDNADKSINNPWCWFMWGGQWHNNHHTMPWCYTTKVKWWEFDLCGWIIKRFLATEINDYNEHYKIKKVTCV
jgi:stearoyl-CoA desaturase (delta-9 desaturase)